MSNKFVCPVLSGRALENMDNLNGLTVPKWVLMIWSKIPKMPNLSAQAQKFEIFEQKLSLAVRSPFPSTYLISVS